MVKPLWHSFHIWYIWKFYENLISRPNFDLVLVWRLHDHDDMLKCGSLGPLNGMLNGMLNVFQGDCKWHDWWVYLLENCNRHQRPHLEITMAGIHPFVFHEQHLLSRMIWFGLISVENRNHSFWARVSASLQPLHVKHMRSRHGEINVAWNGPLAQNTSYISLHDHTIGLESKIVVIKNTATKSR